jgi:hypothetical protein
VTATLHRRACLPYRPERQAGLLVFRMSTKKTTSSKKNDIELGAKVEEAVMVSPGIQKTVRLTQDEIHI